MNEYISRNLYEAAFIYVNGIPLNTITFRSADQRRANFHFDNKDSMAQKMAHDYYADVSAPAWSLFSALTRLKNEMIAAKGQASNGNS